MISIIILCYNQLKYTKECLKSILEFTSQLKTPYEIIVVDNASNDGTKEYLQGLEQAGHIKVIYNSENAGFPKGNNQAVAIAKGEYLCLLNNDTIVTADWLTNMLRCIRSDEKLAAVGPWTNFSSGFQAIQPPPEYKGEEELQKYASQFSREEKYVNFLVFFCCLIKKSVWDEIGGLNEAYGIGCFEDNEFCWRVIEKGYKLKICGNVYIHHYTSKTFGCYDDAKKKQEYGSLMARNQKIFLKKINRYETVSLCMIVSDREQWPILKRCLDSVVEYVDEISIVFSYKGLIYNSKLEKQLFYYCDGKIPVNREVIKWQDDFSYARNLSINMAISQWILWLDCDDVLLHPAGMRDVILHNPEIEAFRFKLLSRTEIGTQEIIYHTNLFKNKAEWRFTGRVHEDINPAINVSQVKRSTTDITIQHLGYLNLKTWKQKNLRNYKLLLLDLKDIPSSLVYYHLVNCLLIIGGKENMVKAVQYVDECLKRFKMAQDDPLLPKMWVLRGLACMDAGQMAAAKQSFLKSYDEWKHIEGAVSLAEVYMREKDYDKVIEVLTPVYELKEFPITNIPMDTIQAECMMLEKLGFAYHHKAEAEKDREKIIEYIKKAETHYREYLSIRENLVIIDRLSKILRQTNRMDEAAFLTIRAVNKYTGYFSGWNNLGSYELQCKRFVTAKLFFQEALKLKPNLKEAKHNLWMINKMSKKGQLK